MAQQAFYPVTALITGAAVVEVASGATTESFLLTATTAQSVLDFSKLIVRFENYGSAVTTITQGAGTRFSEIGRGAAAAITLGTSGSATAVLIIGGTSFESARFQATAGTALFTLGTTAASVYASAFMLPSP